MIKKIIWFLIICSVIILSAATWNSANAKTLFQSTNDWKRTCNLAFLEGYELFRPVATSTVTQIQVGIHADPDNSGSEVYYIELIRYQPWYFLESIEFPITDVATSTTNWETFTINNREIYPQYQYFIRIRPWDWYDYGIYWRNTQAINFSSESRCYDPNWKDNYNYQIKVKGFEKTEPSIFKDLLTMIPTAYATTTCTFVTNTNTTTATCADEYSTSTPPVSIYNPTQDLAVGLGLFFVTFFGLLFYFKRK